MSAQNFTLFLLLPMFSGCSIGTAPNAEQPTADHTIDTARDEVLDLRFQTTEDEFNSGQWTLEGGIKKCHGYLTRVADEDFCTATVPKEWKSFTYNGQTYYVQPLAGG